MPTAHADSRGGRENISEIIEKYKSTVYGIALTRLKNRFDADDVFQEVFLTYWRKAPSFNSEEHRRAWIINTAVNCSKKLYRKNRRFYESTSDEEPVCVFSHEEDTELYAALLSLDEKYRTVLYLFYFEDMTAQQIAKLCKLRPGTVRMRLTRARQQLKETLGGIEP